MTDLTPPEGVDQNDWREACQCARLRIMADRSGSRYYGRPDLDEVLFELGCSGISNNTAYPAALEAVRAELDRRQREMEETKERERNWAALRLKRLPPDHERAWERETARSFIGHQRLQLPVGQGGFHVSTLTGLEGSEEAWHAAIEGDAVADADFLYVYDCGSAPLSGVEAEIDLIVGRRTNRRLDMLFVSHFDRDHVGGIPRLLRDKKGFEVDTIVMPYLDDLDRILAFARTAETRAEVSADEFLADLAVDAVGAMRRFNPRVIILVSPDDEEGMRSVGALPPAGPIPTGAGATPWSIVDQGGRSSSSPLKQGPNGTFVLTRGDFEVMSSGVGGWRLKPYVRRAAKIDREAFAAAVEVLLRWKRGSFATQIADEAVRISLVTKHRETLGRAYKWAFFDKNLTSLSLYSGPIRPELAGAVYRGLAEDDQAAVGWIGTGDAGLRGNQDLGAFQSHFRSELPRISTFVLPHHGSIHNYDPATPVATFPLWVAAAQPIHDDWIHPDPAIVDAITAAGAVFRKVGARPDGELDERMVVFW